MCEITEEMARNKYEEYMSAGLKMTPAFKGFGLKFIQFAIDEPEMYKILFLKNRELSYSEYLDTQMEYKKIIPSVQATFSLNELDARWMLRNMFLYAHGMATLFTNSSCVMTESEISENLGAVCRGLLMQLKAPSDERTKIIPGDDNVPMQDDIEEYIKGKKNAIIGYNQDKEMFQIRLEAVLYFEAVGDSVFVYTKGNVYEIKKRLYQIEEYVKSFAFVRISKALLVNTKKIARLSSESGGRGNIYLINGENLIASRAYYKDLVEIIKN